MQSNATPRWAESTTAAVDAAAIGHLSGSGLALAVLAGTRRFRNQTLVNARRNCRWAHTPSLQEEMRHACAMESSDTDHGSMAGRLEERRAGAEVVRTGKYRGSTEH